MIEEKKLQRRYERNSMTITPEENKLLRAKRYVSQDAEALAAV